MAEIRLPATVDDIGRLMPDVPHVWAVSLRAFAGKRVSVSIQTQAHRRSTQANRYWWSCVVPVFQEVWSHGRTALNLPPYDKDQAHEVLVQALAGFEDGPLPGTRVRVKTSDMDAATFGKLIERARELALHDYQMFIPAPGEQYHPVVSE